MSGGVFGTPRDVPSQRGPALAGLAVLLVALPLYVFGGFGFGPWALGAGLWVGGEALALLLTRLPLGLSNLGASGAVGVGLIFRQVTAVVVLFAVVLHDKHLAVGAAILYAAAYTLERALSMVIYFGQEKES